MIVRNIFIFVVAAMTCIVNATACPTCTPRDASVVDTFIHGASPQGPMDYVIAASMIVVVLGTGYLSVRAFFKREPTS